MGYGRSNFPDDFDRLPTLRDLPPTKIQDAKRLQYLKSLEVLSSEESVELNTLTLDLQNYIISPELMNTISDSITGTQKFFVENVQGFITTKQGEMNQYINTKQSEINSYSDTKKNEVNLHVDTQLVSMTTTKNDFTKYVDAKQLETNNYSDTKKNEVNSHVDTQLAFMTTAKDDFTKYVTNNKTELTTAQTSAIASIGQTKDTALISIENKKDNIIAYMDSTTAGQIRNDIGIMGELPTTDKSSLVSAISEVNSTLSTKADSLHKHDVNDVEGLQSHLDTFGESINTKVTNLETNKVDKTDLNLVSNKVSGLQTELNNKVSNLDFNNHVNNDVKHGIFTLNGKRYQGQWLPNADLTGLKFIYNEVIG